MTSHVSHYKIQTAYHCVQHFMGCDSHRKPTSEMAFSTALPPTSQGSWSPHRGSGGKNGSKNFKVLSASLSYSLSEHCGVLRWLSRYIDYIVCFILISPSQNGQLFSKFSAEQLYMKGNTNQKGTFTTTKEHGHHLPPSKNNNNHFRFIHSLPLLWSFIIGITEIYFCTIKFAKLKIKGLSKWEAASIYSRSIRIAIWDTDSGRAQIMFWLGDKTNGYLRGREGE